jgi:hypothetical protein
VADGGRRLVELWDKHQARLRGFAEAGPLEQQAKKCSQYLRACEEFEKVVGRPGSEREIADAWDRLESAGGRPPAAWRARGRQARDRTRCLERLRAIPEDNSEENDRCWERTWKEDLLRGCTEADSLRARHAQTLGRLRLLEELLRAIQQADKGTGAEEAVARAGGKLPARYRHQAADRVKAAGARVAASRELLQALAANPPSDRAIAAAWEKQGPQARPTFDAATRRRCELAVRRRDCLDRLRAIGGDLPLDEQDRRWLSAWKEELLEGCADVTRRLRDRYLEARERDKVWRALERCLLGQDLDSVCRLAGDPRLAGYPPFEHRREEIENLKSRARRQQRIRELASRNMAGFTGEDLDFLRDHGELIASERPRIEAGLRAWVDGQAQLRPCSPDWVSDPRRGPPLVRWAWPPSGLVTHCLVAIEAGRFLQTPDEAEVRPSRIDATNYRRANGFPVPLFEERPRVFVTVWPVIDLGWLRLVGRPLHLGPFAPGPVGSGSGGRAAGWHG